jgi:hypothetical protein
MPRYDEANPSGDNEPAHMRDDYRPPDDLYEAEERTHRARREDLDPLDHGEADHGAPDRPPPMLPDDEDLDSVPANVPGPKGPTEPRPTRAPRVDRPLLIHPESKAWWILAPSGYVRAPADGSMLIAHLKNYHPHLNPFVPTASEPPKQRPMTTGELWEHFGRTVDRVLASYTIDGSRFDPEPADPMRGALYLQAGRRPKVSPVHHAEVAAWLDRLAGRDGIGRLLDWLATCHLLDRPTAALFVYGPPSAGKGLLAAGVAAMFGGERVTLAAATSRFNASLLKSPIVHLDEGAEGGRTASARLRELIGESTHTIEEKHQPRMTLKGCPRVVVTTNNPDALKIAEELTAEDEAAIGVRLLLIDVPTDANDRTRCPAADYLAEHGGRTFTREWVERVGADGKTEPGKVCEHFAWLQAHREVTHGDRFLVHGDADAWRRRAGERGGIATKILVVLAQLATGERRDADEGAHVVVYRGAAEAWVSASALHRRWLDLTGDRAPPAMKTVAAHLRNLSLDNGPTQRRVSGSPVRAYRIPAAAVLKAAEAHGVGDDDRIRRWFGVVGETGRAEGSR